MPSTCKHQPRPPHRRFLLRSPSLTPSPLDSAPCAPCTPSFCRFHFTQCRRTSGRPAPPCSTLAAVLGFATPVSQSLRLLRSLRSGLSPSLVSLHLNGSHTGTPPHTRPARARAAAGHRQHSHFGRVAKPLRCVNLDMPKPPFHQQPAAYAKHATARAPRQACAG